MTALAIVLLVAQGAQHRLDSGNAAFNDKKWDVAIREFTYAIELDEDCLEAYLKRGHAHYYMRDYKAAIGDYKAVVKLDESHGGALYAIGLAHQILKEHKEAVAAFTECLKYHAQHVYSYVKRGESRRQLLDFAGAVEDFGIAVDMNPNLREGYERRAMVNEDLGQYEAAAADYTTLIKLGAKASDYRNRARAYFFLDKRAAADEDFKNAIFLDEKDTENYIVRARIRKLAGNYEGALADCDVAADLDKRNARPFLIRGLIQYDFGHFRKARIDLYKATKRAKGVFEPDYIMLYQCLVRLRRNQAEKGRAELAAYFASKKKKASRWYAEVVKFLTGKIGEKEFLEAAESSVPKTTAEQRCEAYFYAGTVRLANKDDEGAHALFKKCVETNVRSFIEYESATIALLKR